MAKWIEISNDNSRIINLKQVKTIFINDTTDYYDLCFYFGQESLTNLTDYERIYDQEIFHFKTKQKRDQEYERIKKMLLEEKKKNEK